MRVAIVTDTYPPDVNGVATCLQRLSHGLVERGHEVEVFRPKPAAGDDPVAPPESACREYRVPGVPLPRYGDLRLGLPRKRRLLTHWQQTGPDAVYVATEGPLGRSAVSAARRLGIPAVSGYHTHFPEYLAHYRLPFLGSFAEHYLQRVHNDTSSTLAPTQSLVDDLGRRGFRNVQLLGRGVDTELFSPHKRRAELRRGWGAADGDPVVLYVGRIAPEKNLPLALSSLRQLRAAHPRAKAVMVGEGPARRELERQFPEAVWTGVKRGQELAAHYASADIFVFPSETDTFGNVVLEAMASGLVPVAFAMAAAGEFVENRHNGFTAPPGDRAALRDALRRALNSRAHWPAIRAAARETASGRSWDAIVHRFESLLANASQPRRPAGGHARRGTRPEPAATP